MQRVLPASSLVTKDGLSKPETENAKVFRVYGSCHVMFTLYIVIHLSNGHDICEQIELPNRVAFTIEFWVVAVV